MIRIRLGTTTETPSDQQLAKVRRLVVVNLTRKGFPLEDAEDVAQEILLKITEAPGDFMERLNDLDNHVGYFISKAFTTYLMLLRKERRRRQREERFSLSATESGDLADGSGHDSDALLALAAQAPLTELQRDYLTRVLVDRRFLDEIAQATGTSERAVRAVLQRAARTISRHMLGQAS